MNLWWDEEEPDAPTDRCYCDDAALHGRLLCGQPAVAHIGRHESLFIARIDRVGTDYIRDGLRCIECLHHELDNHLLAQREQARVESGADPDA